MEKTSDSRVIYLVKQQQEEGKQGRLANVTPPVRLYILLYLVKFWPDWALIGPIYSVFDFIKYI